MRVAGTFHLGGTFETQQPPPPQHRHHVTPPPTGWKSPVPYLFGGLAAMLGLIAFALLVLACSYWKLSGEDSAEDTGDVKLKENAPSKFFPDSVLVIMAGEERPTFLAMPAISKTSSLGDAYEQSDKASCSSGGDDKEEKVAEVEARTTTSRASTNPEEEKSRENDNLGMLVEAGL